MRSVCSRPMAGRTPLRPVFEELNRRKAVIYVHPDVWFIFKHGVGLTLISRAIERDNAVGPLTMCAAQFDRYVAEP
jgi:hypothetical protein